MTKGTFPNKTGDYDIDGISIIVLPDKIIVDASGYRGGNRRASRSENDDDEPTRAAPKGKTSEKKGDWLNDMLDNAQGFLTGDDPRDKKKQR